jgi:TatD DNase family protein
MVALVAEQMTATRRDFPVPDKNLVWADTHCHLDAPEFQADLPDVMQRAFQSGVRTLVIPAVSVQGFETVRELAHAWGLAYALGIHPLAVQSSPQDALVQLDQALNRYAHDDRLVAVGEIGLDFWVPGHDRDRQKFFYETQLAMARDAGLPVLLHVRQSADALAAGLRRLGSRAPRGIVHAFNGSSQQARVFLGMGFKLGFGGTLSFDRALNIRRLARELGDTDMVLETDAPDMPPRWLYRTQEERKSQPQARNEPAELPRIGAELAALRGQTPERVAQHTFSAACEALPRLSACRKMSGIRPPAA